MSQDDDLRQRLIWRIRCLGPAELKAADELLARLQEQPQPPREDMPPIQSGGAPPHSRALNAADEFEKQAQPRSPRPIQSGGAPPHAKAWPHAPTHRLSEAGTFIVTAGTWQKQHHFCDADRLSRLESELLALAQGFGWRLEAWAVFSNHYHFVGHSPEDPETLRSFLGQLHAKTAAVVNELEGAVGRKIWHNFWETRLTYERSYLARLNYVHQNAVRHGLVRSASHYPFCSAGWFERTATRAQVSTIYSFKIDKLRLLDDFDVVY